MYLKVLSLANIVNAAGTHILLHKTVQSAKCKFHFTYLPIHQESPPTKSWYIWYNLLGQFCDSSGELFVPLSKWIVPLNKIRIRHELLYYIKIKTHYDSSTMQPIKPITELLPELILNTLIPIHYDTSQPPNTRSPLK